MNRLILAAVLAAGCTFASSVPALGATRNYDCSKPGNANKAACKGAQAAPKSEAAKPTKEEKGKSAKEDTKAKGTKEAKAAPSEKPAATASTERHYDCTKAGNANKAACKGAGGAMSAAAKPAPKSSSMPKPKPTVATAQAAPPPMKKAAAGSSSAENNNPAGAIAQCKDGTYSHSKTHNGACSHHGGVGKWIG